MRLVGHQLLLQAPTPYAKKALQSESWMDDATALWTGDHDRHGLPHLSKGSTPLTHAESFPSGLYRAIKASSVLGIPIFITETGVADGRDDRRHLMIEGYTNEVPLEISHDWASAGQSTQAWIRCQRHFLLDTGRQL